MKMTAHIILNRPKFPHNVGGALRAASCFDAESVWFTGERFSTRSTKGNRLPREERMKGYSDVDLRQGEYPFDFFPNHIPIAIEVRENSEQLPDFEHPEDAVYVFGPEDGSIQRSYLRHCHRFVVIPTKHCTNLAAAVYITLYDRMMKRLLSGQQERCSTKELMASESRGWVEHEEVVA